MELLKVMINAVKGVCAENYSKEQTSEAIRAALIEMNGGSNKISLKNFYRGSQIYSLVQDLLPTIIDEGLDISKIKEKLLRKFRKISY